MVSGEEEDCDNCVIVAMVDLMVDDLVIVALVMANDKNTTMLDFAQPPR